MSFTRIFNEPFMKLGILCETECLSFSYVHSLIIDISDCILLYLSTNLPLISFTVVHKRPANF
jgi:hypothetical protein